MFNQIVVISSYKLYTIDTNVRVFLLNIFYDISCCLFFKMKLIRYTFRWFNIFFPVKELHLISLLFPDEDWSAVYNSYFKNFELSPAGWYTILHFHLTHQRRRRNIVFIFLNLLIEIKRANISLKSKMTSIFHYYSIIFYIIIALVKLIEERNSEKARNRFLESI